MYHQLAVLKNLLPTLLALLFTSLLAAPPALQAAEMRSGAVQQTAEPPSPDLSNRFAVIKKAKMKTKPLDAVIYQYDASPLGDRHPFLLVHGLKGEYYPCFRWGKVIKRMSEDRDFSRRFKIYLVRYNTLVDLSQTVPQMKACLSALSEATFHRPIGVMALSIGGNLVYEAMLDQKIDPTVGLLLALGTPFRGTPLFNADWVQYGIYKRMALPWTRIDHAVAYRMYFARNPNLLADFSWDDCDNAIPNIGRFSSLLPFGPSGNLTADDSINRRLLALDQHPVDHKKIITYSGYMLNPYLKSDPQRIFERTILYPYSFVTVKVPAHLFREHPVLKVLNHTIATVVTTPEAESRAKTRFVYGLNDGITPLASALFLPQKFCLSEALSREIDVAKVKKVVDVRTARVFRNIDHLSFIDGYRPMTGLLVGGSVTMRDELNPEAGARDIFGWMLSDINHSFEESNTPQKEACLGVSTR
jgi:hypothetical protein